MLSHVGKQTTLGFNLKSDMEVDDEINKPFLKSDSVEIHDSLNKQDPILSEQSSTKFLGTASSSDDQDPISEPNNLERKKDRDSIPRNFNLATPLLMEVYADDPNSIIGGNTLIEEERFPIRDTSEHCQELVSKENVPFSENKFVDTIFPSSVDVNLDENVLSCCKREDQLDEDLLAYQVHVPEESVKIMDTHLVGDAFPNAEVEPIAEANMLNFVDNALKDAEETEQVTVTQDNALLDDDKFKPMAEETNQIMYTHFLESPSLNSQERVSDHKVSVSNFVNDTLLNAKECIPFEESNLTDKVQDESIDQKNVQIADTHFIENVFLKTEDKLVFEGSVLVTDAHPKKNALLEYVTDEKAISDAHLVGSEFWVDGISEDSHNLDNIPRIINSEHDDLIAEKDLLSIDTHIVNNPLMLKEKSKDEEPIMQIAEYENPITNENIPTVDEKMQMETKTCTGSIGTEVTETEVTEMETNVVGMSSASGKRKRGRTAKTRAKAPQTKAVEEDVCFICFDGGELVLCDRRGCPKVYHPSCVNRDEAFFQAKGKWNCGWHLCSICEKNAYYMCYTCTYSLCKGCIKDNVILSIRGKKGLCEACMKTVMLIEKNEQDQFDFNDKTSFEYLFKDYWSELKGILGLTSDEITQAKNPWKGFDASSDPDNSFVIQYIKPKRLKGKNLSKSLLKAKGSASVAVPKFAATPASTDWASNELLEFVMHMKNGDRSVLSQFDVQALLLEYIKENKLRDPRRKSQIICDSRLENMFSKARVGHFEMLKLLESHFLIIKDSQASDVQGSVVDTETCQVEVERNGDILIEASKDRKRKMRKKGARGLQSNLDDYAAIDMHNINLIYLRRNLTDDLIRDSEAFQEKVVGSFVRIRISGNVQQKQDIYRLVQVVGTSKKDEPYKVGQRTTDIILEILNLNKTEIISIDIISNQDFTEDECKRLRQSIKCGFINRLTVGDVLEKAMTLHAVRVKDMLEGEIVRLNHLIDRASENGRIKDHRECVEKLERLKTAEERQRRLEEIPVVHADPNMDPSHESEDDEEEDNKRQEIYTRPRATCFGRRGQKPISPGTCGSHSNDSWNGMRKPSSKNWELSRNLTDKNFANRREHVPIEMMNETFQIQGRDSDPQQINSIEKLRTSNTEASDSNGLATNSALPPSVGVIARIAPKISESEKIWHYQDPSGKVQGPFSMVQLRKWSGHFPANLRVWKNYEKQDDSVLLMDNLSEYFPNEVTSVDDGRFSKAYQTHNSQSLSTRIGEKPNIPQNLETGKLQAGVGMDSGSLRDTLSLPSSTPTQIQSVAESVQSTDSYIPSIPLSSRNAMPNSSQSVEPNESQGAWAPNLSGVSRNPGVTKTVGPILSNLAQSIGALGWGPGLVSQPGQIAPQPGQIAPQPVSQTLDLNSSIPMAVTPPTYGQWAPLVPGTSVQPPAQQNLPWANPSATPYMDWAKPPVDPNMGWALVDPNMVWAGPATVSNVNWTDAGSNMNWVQGQVAMPGSMNPLPMNASTNWGSTNMSWAPTGPIPGNPNPGWAAPRDSTGVGRPQNRHAFGQTRTMCKYFESGHCNKGANCYNLHPRNP